MNNPEELNKSLNNDQEENENEDLIPETNEKNNNNEELDQNDSNNPEEEDSNNSSDNDQDNKSMKLEEESINQEENKEKDDKIISNPIANPEKDLGYNPLTKNKNKQGNNTAKNTKDALNELNEEENNNNDIDFDQLENLEQSIQGNI